MNAAPEVAARAAVSIVIVSWNTRDLLAKCLATLRAVPGSPTLVDGLPADVVVVDNASRDGSPEMVRERFPWVRLIANRDNLGFARANNQVLPGCRKPYVLLLNPDTEVAPGAIRTLVEFLESQPDAGAAGARLLDPDGRLQESCHPEPTLGRELWSLLHLDGLVPWARYCMSEWSPNVPRQVEVVQGACLLLRRAALDDVGPLDEQYFMYSEEVDLCRRLRLNGWRIFWVPRAAVVHYSGQSTRQMATAMFVRLYQGKILYFRKHSGARAARIYKLILLIAALARLAVGPLVLAERSPRRELRMPCLAATCAWSGRFPAYDRRLARAGPRPGPPGGRAALRGAACRLGRPPGRRRR
jgi:GT2 family glycosyltransferase